MALNQWALTQLSEILPLDEDSLKQVIEYSLSLPNEGTAEHLKTFLGDSPRALEFIAALNSRRSSPQYATRAPLEQAEASDEASKKQKQKKKKKPPLHQLPPPRQPEDHGNTEGAYHKHSQEQVYMPGSSSTKPSSSGQRSAPSDALAHRPASSSTPSTARTASPAHKPKPPPSASGSLISDLPNVRIRTAHAPTPVSAPKKATSATPIQELDSAIAILATTSDSSAPRRRCGCQATRHALLASAPNCLSCGKIVCVKEGLGPCTFCGTALLTAAQIADVTAALRAERALAKVAAHNDAQRRHRSGAADEARAQAQAHRDQLLGFQAENAQRTRVVDEAAAFETPAAGAPLWGSAAERAAQLKRQQRVLRAVEAQAKPEWERTKTVLSLDVSGGKVVKRIQKARNDEAMSDGEADLAEDYDDNDDNHNGNDNDDNDGHQAPGAASATKGTGKLSHNPLMRGLIRPIWRVPAPTAPDADAAIATNTTIITTNSSSDNRADGHAKTEPPAKQKLWRRVQDDSEDDNEAWILDGGVYGGRDEERRIGEEPSGGHGHG